MTGAYNLPYQIMTSVLRSPRVSVGADGERGRKTISASSSTWTYCHAGCGYRSGGRPIEVVDSPPHKVSIRMNVFNLLNKNTTD